VLFRSGEANSLGSLGNAYFSLGEYRRAIEFHEQSLAISQSIGDRFGQAASFFNRARALAKIDDYWAGRQSLEQARELFVELQLDHRIEQCDALIRKYTQIIAAQPRQAPKIGSPEPVKAQDDWYQKSLPSYKPATTSGSGNQWIFYVAIVIVVVVLIVVLQ